MRRRFAAVGVVAVLMCVSAATAQNARLNAMSGFSLFGDVSDVLGNPGYMGLYKDVIQGSYDGAPALGVGPVIGIKAIGDMISAGVTYDPTALYAGQSVPHLLLGVGNDTWTIGLELFYERDWEHEYEENVDPVTPVTTVDENVTIVSYMGAQAGFVLNTDAVMLAITLGGSLPYEKTYTLTQVTGLPDNETTVKLSSTIDLNGGVDAYLDIADYTLGVGVYGGLSLYGKLESDVNGTVTDGGSDDMDIFAGVFGGLIKEFEDYGLKVGVMADGQLYRTRTQPIDGFTLITYDPGAVWSNALALMFTAGLEKEWTNLKYLNAIRARTGLYYGIFEIIDHREGDTASYSHEYRLKNATFRTPQGFGWTLGAGVEKGICAFDVVISPTAVLNALDWANGQFAANDLISVSLTLDFKNISKKSSSGRSSAPQSAPESSDSGLSF